MTNVAILSSKSGIERTRQFGDSFCWSFSPSVAEYAMVVEHQFWQPTWHLGKGWTVRGTTNGLTGSSTQAGTGGTELQLIGSSVADCQTACQQLIYRDIVVKSWVMAKLLKETKRNLQARPLGLELLLLFMSLWYFSYEQSSRVMLTITILFKKQFITLFAKVAKN